MTTTLNKPLSQKALKSNKKYRLYGKKNEDGFTRIQALRDIPRHKVKQGDLGGWVLNESNLSQKGDSWISEDAEVSGNARVYGNALVSGDADISGEARVYGDIRVFGNTEIAGRVHMSGHAQVSGDARIF